MFKTRSILGLFAAATVTTVIVALAGCTQSGTTPPPLIPNPAPPLPVRPAQLVVGDSGNHHILIFPLGGTGTLNESPINVINEGHSPSRVARDTRGNIFVGDNSLNEILIYDETATGNAPPVAVINPSASGTQLGVVVTPDNSSVYGADFGAGVITLFGPLGPSGSIAATTTISGSNTHLVTPNYLAVDTSANLWVSDTSGQEILEFAAGASGNVAPLKRITTATGVYGLALDSSNNIFVVTSGNNIREYAAGANGAAVPIKLWTGLPVNPNGLAVDSTYVYATYSPAKEICWFPISSASGVPTLTACIQGTNTGFTNPLGLTF